MNEKSCGTPRLGPRARNDAVIFENAIVKYTFRASVCAVIPSNISEDITFRHYLVGCSFTHVTHCIPHASMPLLLPLPLPLSLSERVLNKFQWIIIPMDFWRGQTGPYERRTCSVCHWRWHAENFEAHAQRTLAVGTDTSTVSLVFDHGLVINAYHLPYTYSTWTYIPYYNIYVWICIKLMRARYRWSCAIQCGCAYCVRISTNAEIYARCALNFHTLFCSVTLSISLWFRLGPPLLDAYFSLPLGLAHPHPLAIHKINV